MRHYLLEAAMHPGASAVVTVGMATLPLIMAAIVVRGYAMAAAREGEGRAARLGIGIAIWMAIVALLGLAGVLQDPDARPPPLALLMGIGFVLTTVVACSRVGARLAHGLPIAAIVGVQAFRLPLELVLHRAATEGVMPMQMSFGGSNFDIVSGISAIVVAVLAARASAPRWLLWAFWGVSSALLATIIGIAIASTPVFAAFGRSPERLNTWIGWLPFTWLPCVLVPVALLGQIVLFRRLRLASIA